MTTKFEVIRCTNDAVKFPSANSLHASRRREDGLRGEVFKAHSTPDRSQGLEDGSCRS